MTWLETNGSVEDRKCMYMLNTVEVICSQQTTMCKQTLIVTVPLQHFIVSYEELSWVLNSLVIWHEVTNLRKKATSATIINFKTLRGINKQPLNSQKGMLSIRLGRHCVCQSIVTLSLTQPILSLVLSLMVLPQAQRSSLTVKSSFQISCTSMQLTNSLIKPTFPSLLSAPVSVRTLYQEVMGHCQPSMT